MRWTVWFAAMFIAIGATLSGCPGTPVTPVYFIVSQPYADQSESFILPLTRPVDILHARALIADLEGTDAHIAVAKIARSTGSEDVPNRDVLNPPTIWSWHVVEFVGFADFTIEIYDGNPSYVDDNLDQWIDETNGAIGFWSYTVTRELDPEELK